MDFCFGDGEGVRQTDQMEKWHFWTQNSNRTQIQLANQFEDPSGIEMTHRPAKTMIAIHRCLGGEAERLASATPG